MQAPQANPPVTLWSDPNVTGVVGELANSLLFLAMDWKRAGLVGVLMMSTLVAVEVVDDAVSVVQASRVDEVGGPDFDDDGFVDLAVGLPHVPTGGSAQLSGAIAIVYGDNEYSGPEDGTAGFDHDPFEGRKQVLLQSTFDPSEDSGEFDAFGYNFVWGDFNSDGYDDLAAGVPRENHELGDGVVLESAGRVLVIYGSSVGLSPTSASAKQVLDLNSVVNSAPQAGDWFGDSLVVGDFNGDGRDDLAVASPYAELGDTSAGNEFEDQGRVDVFAGTAKGLTNLQTVVPTDPGVDLSPLVTRYFGTSIGAGDVNGDGADELVVASLVPGSSNGQVSIVYGTNSEAGLALSTPPPDAAFQPLGIGPVVPTQTSDGLGESVDVGDFNGDGFGDVVAGAPNLDILNGTGELLRDAGGAIVVSGSASGIAPNATATRPGFALWTQDSPSVPGGAERGDNFGFDVAAGYFDFDDHADLAISAPGESIGTLGSAGAVVAIYGAENTGLSSAVRPMQFWDQNSSGILGASEPGDRLGETLAIADYDSDGTHDLAIGAPLEDIGSDFFDAGAVNVIFGGAPGLSKRGNQQLFISGDRLDSDSGFTGVFGFIRPYQQFGAGLDGEGLENDWDNTRWGPGSAPLNPQAYIGDGTVTLIWRPPVDTGGRLLDYVIEGPGTVVRQNDSTLSISSATIADLPNDAAVTFTIRGAAGAPGASITVTPKGALRAIAPTRFLETRPGEETFDGLFETGTRVPAGGEVRFDPTRGPVDADASAVMLNIVAVNPLAAGFLTAYPCEGDPPLAASVNYKAGDVLPNAVFVQTSPTGEVCIFSLADTDIVVDVTGYVPADGTTVGVRPARYLETRPGEDTFDGAFETATRVPADDFVRVKIADRGVVPEGVRTVLLNVATVGGASAGFATAYPCGVLPLTANINYGPGGVTSNAVTAQLTFDGDLCVYSSAEVDIVLDVYGYIDGAFSPRSLAPARLVDTRTDGSADTVDGQFEGSGRIGAGEVETFRIAGRGGVDFVGSDAALINVVAVHPAAAGFLTVFDCVGKPPLAANVNYRAGDVAGNAVLAKMSASGDICVFSLAETDVVIDVNGMIEGDPRLRD